MTPPPAPRKTLNWILITVGAFMIWGLLSTNAPDPLAQATNATPPQILQDIPYSDLLIAADKKQLAQVVLEGQNARGRMHEGTWFTTRLPEGDRTVERLAMSGAKVIVAPESNGGIFGILLALLPILIPVAFMIFILRQMAGAGGRLTAIGKSKAKVLTEAKGKVTFKDVAGVEEAKQDLEEIVDFLRDPRRFQRLGGKIPKGVLLVGPPGTGKTLLARAVAGEANVPVFTTSGSAFVEMFVGIGASRVRDLFEQAKKQAPCIVFIDEIDAVGRHRGAGHGGGNDEREQTLNQILVEMDGFEGTDGIILVAATNRPDVLDPALLRPGRFDRQVMVPNPDLGGRVEILNVHVRKVPLAPDVDLRAVARGTPGFSGADLANLVNEAALYAARFNRSWVVNADFEAAKDKVMMGSERRSLALSDEEKMLTAVHEAGHAVVGALVAGNDPVHKVTIIPRGRAMGVTLSLPEKDRFGYKASELHARLAMMYGGRVAEQLIFGPENVSTGASQDLTQISEMARRMVCEWGMSDALGALRFNAGEQESFLGRGSSRLQVSEHTARVIDEEIAAIAKRAEALARATLENHKDALERLTQALLEFETVSGPEVLHAIRGEKIERGAVPTPPVRSSFVPHIGAPRPAHDIG